MDRGLVALIAIGLVMMFGTFLGFLENEIVPKKMKQRCYDLSREPSQVELCKELFGEK